MATIKNHHKYAHIPSLHAINKQLLAPDKDLKDRFLCLGFVERWSRRCAESAQNFPAYRTGMMKKTSDALKKTEVSNEDFVTIVRSLFCGYHDIAEKFQSFKTHLQLLWRNADAETQNVFLEAIRLGHEEIFKHYANLKGCLAEDIEHAIETEELGDDALPDISNGDRNDYQIIAYDPKQHSLLTSIRELVGSQAMYDKPHADGHESSDEPHANTSGTSAFAIPTLGMVGNNHEIADKKTSQPKLFNFAPGVETTGDSLERQQFGDASQTNTLVATKNRNDFTFSFECIPKQTREELLEASRRMAKAIDFQMRTPKVPKSPKPMAVENTASRSRTASISQYPNVAAKDSASMKEPELTLNPWNTFESGKFVNGASIPKSEPWEPSHGGPSSRLPPFSVTSGNTRIKDDSEEDRVSRDNRSDTPDSTMPGFKSNQNTSAQISSKYRLTPPAKNKRREVEVKLPGTKQRAVLELHCQESPSPAPPTPNFATSEQISAHDERPMVAATPPTMAGVLGSDYTPRNETRTPRKPRVIAERIKNILCERIDYSNKGYIYVLKAHQFFEKFPPSRDRPEPEQWVKIGITRNIDERINSLSGRCGITDLVECDDVLEEPMPMPLLRRVERLCHEELANFQRPFNCNETNTRCDTVHKEWFNVTEEVAVRTVKRWLLFISKNPYTTHGNLKSGFWEDVVCNGEYLKTSMDDDLDRTHERYQSWLETSIQQYETNIAEEKLQKLSVGKTNSN